MWGEGGGNAIFPIKFVNFGTNLLASHSQTTQMRNGNETTCSLPLGIGVGCGDHLWEVNDCWLVFGIQEDIELVKVTMDEAIAGQLDNEVH